MGIIREQTLGMLTTAPKFGCGVSAVGNMSSNQSYDATTGIYEPDYRLTPLTLQVDVAAIDPDTRLQTGNARKQLTNIHWYEIDRTGKKIEITITGGVSTPAGYTQLINTEGDEDAGRLQIAKNAAPGEPIMLRIEADLYAGSDVFRIAENFNVHCRDTTPAVRCKFDTPDIVPYNPIHDGADLPIELSVWENNHAADRGHYIPVWEVRRDSGTWSAYGSEVTDYWLEIAADLHTATLKTELMGDEASIRVRLRYDRNGNPGGVLLGPGDIFVPMCRMECRRTLGRYDHRMVNVTNTIAEWTTVVRPRVVFKDNKGDIADAEKYFTVTFYAGAAGALLTEADAVGTGLTTDIASSRGSAAGLKIGYSVEEIGPLKAWEDSDGSIITDSDGSILLIR